MKAQGADVIREVLEADAERTVRVDMDLWPIVSARLASRRTRNVLDSAVALRSLRSNRPAALRVGVALLLAALLLVVALPWLSREQGSAEAAALLNNLAVVAAAQPGSVSAGTLGYRYVKAETMYTNTLVVRGGEPIVALVPKTRAMWVAPDGSGRIRETADEVIFLSDRARSAWQAAGSPELARPINRDFGPGGLSYEDLARLPTDPKALAAVIRERASRADPPLDVEMFIVVGDLLRQPGAAPHLRAALYKVAASIPGVELIGSVRDRAGRQGVAVAKTTDHWGSKQRFVVIFDPRTSALLAEERVLLESTSWIEAKPPVVIGYATYLEWGIVQSLPPE